MEALTLAEALGMRPLQAHGHQGLGMLDATTGQQEQACTELSTASGMSKSMNMTFWLPLGPRRHWRRWRGSEGLWPCWQRCLPSSSGRLGKNGVGVS